MPNRFLKLLAFSVNKGESILLYGFSLDTEQEQRPWKQVKDDQQKAIWQAVLTSEKADQFEQQLTLSQNIELGNEIYLCAPTLTIRHAVLSNEGHKQQDGPVPAYQHLTEFWNTRKAELLQQIEESLVCKDKARYDQMMNLLAWLKKECGVDFALQGHRFGNYEHYQKPKPSMHFDIECTNDGSQSVVLRRSEDLDRACVVNCSLAGRGRWMNNRIGMLAVGETTLVFTADEPIACVAVQVWDTETGKLAFSKTERYWGSSVHLTGTIESWYQFEDNWSKKLMKSASNRASIIENQVQTITRSSPWINQKIVSPTYNDIDDAIRNSSSLFAKYPHDTLKGAFIQNLDKDGEIYSYIKIKEYIEKPTVEKVIIADPFFSTDAAEKILCRIGRRDVQIEVITAENIKNPDNDGKKDQGDQSYWNTKNAFEKFFEERKWVIHKNLTIHILSRGNGHVFHDRYLIQYHTDGSIQGYLLSNSLNSMGKFYPFVVAPMEHGTCLGVCKYLHELCDPAIQTKIRRVERIHCDTLHPVSVENQPIMIQRYNALLPWYNDKGELVLSKAEMAEAVAAVMADETLHPYQLCHALSDISMTRYDWTNGDLAEVLRGCDYAAETFLATFPEEAARAEEAEKSHCYVRDMEDPICQLRMLLSGEEKLNLYGWNMLLMRLTHIRYTNEAWLDGAYRLMLALDPIAYIALLEKLNSPLMFAILAVPMMFDSRLDHLYHPLFCSDNSILRLLAAECMFRFMDEGEWNIKQVAKTMKDIPPAKKVLQTAYLLSRVKYRVRVLRRGQNAPEAWQEMYQELLLGTAEALSQCPDVDVEQVLQHLFECDVCSRCQMILDLAEVVKKDSPLQKDLYQQAFKVIRGGLLDEHQPLNQDLAQHLSLYLLAIEKAYGEKAEKEMLGDNKTISRSVFETATEPGLKNYCFDQWRKAHVRATWQIKLLHEYLACHPDAEKTAAWIAEWEQRMFFE